MNLHYHLLARNRTTGERQLVALATPAALRSARDARSSETVRQVTVYGPGRGVRTRECRSTVAARLGVGAEHCSISVAGADWRGHGCLS